MSAIKNLIKAHKAQAITRDTHSLQEYLVKFQDKNKIAGMSIVGLETKYIPQFDKNSPLAKPDAQSNGFRTRFILENGETVGTFSFAAYQFFVFFSKLMGYSGDEQFLHIDINGNIKVELSKVELDGNKSTYNFELLEEGSDLKGFEQYLPTADNILLLEDGSSVDTETGEKVETPAE